MLFVWNKMCLFLLCFCFRYYRNCALVITAFVEVYHTVNESIQGVVLADTHVLTWVVLCAALANDDVAGDTLLATPDLNTLSLRS